MKMFGVIAGGLLLPGVLGAQALSVNRDSAWFKPALVVNSAPVCVDLLGVEQHAFFSMATAANHERAGFKLIRRMYEEVVTDPQVEIVPDSFGQLLLTLPEQQRAVVYFHNNGGCGGACETEQVMVADKAFDPLPSRGHDLPATPRAAGWTLFKSAEGEFYALGYPEGNLQAYRIASSSRTEIACEVQLQPRDPASSDDSSVREAWATGEKFLSALGAMSQGAGTCGSLNANWTRRRRAVEAMHQALYRPWASNSLQRLAEELGDADSWSQGQEAIDHNLLKWSLSGVAEHRAFNEYRQQLGRTTSGLSRFYQEKFGWSETQAGDAASRVLQGVLDRAFAFSSSFDRFGGGQALRQAILERRPLSEIDELHQVQRRDAKPPDPFAEASQYDSVLNAAIEYPEALQYLLEQGLDPNVTNGFGKTPLMYAAQYDQIESARILLRADADPNAATYPPEDTCFYTLASSGVTALHYAARYASAPLIQLLVANGAATSSKALRDYSSPEEYPLDWLNNFTGVTQAKEPIHSVIPPERNSKITSAELPALQELLRVTGDEESN